VLTSGEALPADLVRRFHERLGGVELHNLYGPTEAAVDVTWWPCAGESGARPISIGRPIANTAVYVLDRNLRPVPLGSAGELGIGGVQIARGYWGRPDLTAERFVPDPAAPEPGARLYRTGDLVRHRPEGELEYLGRIDHQVKVRGVRIELGEIEAVLAAHPRVREAVVVALGDRLVAYAVPALGTAPGEGGLGESELRAYLRERLPDPMIPAAWVMLPALPLSPNGKVDRQALPAPESARPETAFGRRA
jgi:acyl-coenzyme A synthetase/AMP-(fatty) acid ligase